MIHSSRRDHAVSDTIGSVLMVAIVFLLALSVGNFILGQYSESNAPVSASVEFQNNPDDSVEVVWTGKESAEQITVTNGTTEKTITDLGESVRMWFGPDGDDIDVYAEADPDRRTLITQYESPQFESTVYMESSTCDSPGYCGSQIVFNGSDIPTTDRGVNILVFDAQGRFQSHAYYNTDNKGEYRPPTYTLAGDGTPDMNPVQSCSGCADTQALNYLQTLPEDHYIVLVGDGQPGNVQASLEEEYERMGADFSNDDALESGDSWILVTEKTANTNPDEYDIVFERHTPRGDQSGVEKVTAYFHAPHDD